MRLSRAGYPITATCCLRPAATVARRISGAILAQGEATGHHHAIEDAAAVQLYEDTSGRDTQAGSVRFMRLTQESVLKHQEHAPIALPRGNYKVTRQREYTPEAIRNVAD